MTTDGRAGEERRPDAAPFGISAALTTAFDAAGGIDVARLTAHAADLLRRGCSTVTLFGTTGEGASVGMQERTVAFEALAAAGIPGERIVAGVGAPAVADAAAQARAGISVGAKLLLVAPPFYFKAPSEDGLFAWYARFIEAIGSEARLILYHIPEVTAAPLGAVLVRRLQEAFPQAVFGIKDSSGDWQTAADFLALDNIAVLIGDERLLARAARHGAQGAISGIANALPETLVRLLATGQADPRLDALVDAVVSLPVTPAVKALVGHVRDDAAWLEVRPPLITLPAWPAKRLADTFDRLFTRQAA